MPIKFLNDVAVDSSVLYVDTINNRVGVGVASPAVKLHAGSTSTSGVTTEEFRLQSGTSSGNGGTAIANLVTGNFGTSGIYFGNNTTYSSQPVYLQYQRSSNVTTLQFDNIFKIDQNASSIFYINSSSNVGIGTTSPTAKLQVEDSISSGSLFKITTSAAGALQPIFDARAVSNGDTHYDFNVYKSSTKKIQIISANTASITQIDGTGGFDLKGHLKTSLQTVNGGGVLQLHRYGALSLNDDDAYAHIPPSALYINTLSNTSTDYLLLIANQGSDKLAVDLNGNVGIGTTAPADILHVDGARSNFNGIKIGENSTNIQFIDDGKLAVGNNDWLIFTEGGQEFMRAGGQGNVGIGTTSPSQKLHVSGNARVTGAYYDSNNSAGTSGQVLSSTATGTDWIDQGDIIVGEADKAKSVVLRVKNSTASPMTKGQVICEAVSASPPSGNLIEVALADNNGTNTMPALGILNEDLDAAGGANDEGDAIMFGKVSGIDTSAFSVGDEVFVSDTPGGLTITKPTGVKYIQKVGVVIRDDNTNGTIEVFGAGRVNDVPTPLYVDHANQRLGIGAISPGSPLEVSGVGTGSGTGEGIRVTRQGVNGQYISIDEADGSRHRIRAIGDKPFDIFSSASSYGINLHTNSLQRMTITNAGNVGIGTTSPGKKLDINGDTIFRGELVIDGDSSVHSRINQTSSYLEIVGNNTDSADGTRMWIGTGQTDQGFYVNASNHQFRDNSSNTRMIINGSSGNVGIGTTSPAAKLHISGASVDNEGLVKIQNTYSSGGTFFPALYAINTFSNHSYGVVAEFRTEAGSGTDRPALLFSNAHSGSNWQVGQGVYGANDNFAIGYRSTHPGTTSAWSTARLVIDTSGNVGIGTASPSNKLDVNGNIEASRIILPTTGTAGGGTVTTPAGKLDIRSDSTWSNSAIIARTTTNQNPVLAFYRPSGGSATSYPWWLEANGSTFQIKTGSAANIGSETVSTKVTINSSGNVGINTTNPQTGLQLSSSADNRTVGGTDTGIIRLTNTYGSNFGAGGEIQFGLADVSGRDVLSLIKGSYTGFSSGNYGGDLEFHTRNPDGLGLQQRMTITDAGNVGIGTTSPTSKLTVVDDILLTGSSPSLTLTDATSSFVIKTNTAGEGILQTSGTSKPIRFFRNNGSNESMRINGNGYVGIGTTSPAAKLEVEGSDHLFQLSTAATAGSPYLSFNQAGTRRSFIQHADSGDTLKLASEYGGIDFYTGTSGSETEKMTIQSNGNVGIGITAPVVKLHIGTSSGSGSTTEEFRIQTGTGAGYGGNAVVNLNTGAFGKSGIYFGNNGSLSYANQDSFLEYDDFSGETKLNFGNTLTINKGTSSSIYVDSFGRVGLGTTSPQYQLQLSTNSAAKPTSSSWTVVSDERVKTNIRPYETGLQELLQIEPKLFDYNGKAGFDATTKNNIGVIAQEIKDVMPETVKKYNAKLNEEDEEDTELYNFDSHALTFALINSVKELNAKIKSLETKIQTLENQ